MDQILREASDEPVTSSAGATAAGDERRLRGIPAIGRATSGAVSGSDPVRALLAKEAPRTLEPRCYGPFKTCGPVGAQTANENGSCRRTKGTKQPQSTSRATR